MTTLATAPMTVPIIRNQPLRSDAPRLRLTHHAAAVAPAQDGVSSSSQNAT